MPVDLSRKGRRNFFCIAALLISLIGVFMSIREIDPGDEVRDRIIWAAAAVLSVALACIGLWQHCRYQGMHGKGLGITALVISFAAMAALAIDTLAAVLGGGIVHGDQDRFIRWNLNYLCQ